MVLGATAATGFSGSRTQRRGCSAKECAREHDQRVKRERRMVRGTKTSPLRSCFKRRRACKIPPKAIALPADRTLSAPELGALSDEELLRRAHDDVVLLARDRGVKIGLFGNHCALPDEGDDDSKPTFFHANEVRAASDSIEAFFEEDLDGVRLRSSAFKAIAEEKLGFDYFGAGECIVACLLRGGAAEFRRDDLHAMLYMPNGPT